MDVWKVTVMKAMYEDDVTTNLGESEWAREYGHFSVGVEVH